MSEPDTTQERNFRFFDNRQKYLLFVNTCSEKEIVARRVSRELDQILPKPPAVRIFDAGMGDATVLSRVLRDLHRRYPTRPFYVVGKEISLEDVRLSLDKMADRFQEHPATVLVVTNMYYTEAPWLQPKAAASAERLVWQEAQLTGTTASEFTHQIEDLEPFLERNWQARPSPKTGNPMYDRPVALVVYRKDFEFGLANIIPQKGAAEAGFDLVLASQPYRARMPADFKATRVIAPLAMALRPGGRLLGVHSCGADPGLEIIQRMWPGEQPFATSRHDILREVKAAFGDAASQFILDAGSDADAIFRYAMHALPTEMSGGIGTSTLFAAWNAAVYVAQIDDERLTAALGTSRYLDITREVLREYKSLWFNDEAYVISRRQDRP